MLVSHTWPQLHVSAHSIGGECRWDILENQATVCFEVKTRIDSLGEVIRQIRMYQAHVGAPFYVVCPDDRFRAALNEQKIGFIKCPG